MRRVVVRIQGNGTIAVDGLASHEEDDLYEQLEAKFGKDEVSATIGAPYVVAVFGTDASAVHAFIKSYCERLGCRVSV